MTEQTPDGAFLVPLTRGRFAVVDAEDASKVRDAKWHLTSHGYASGRVRTPSGLCRVFMHRLILPARGMVDHIDGDRLNNRRSNLREVTPSQNQSNRHWSQGRSRYKGVYVSGNAGRWGVEINKDGHKLFLGYYEDEERAARVYDAAAKVFFGKYAKTNRALGLLEAA